MDNLVIKSNAKSLVIPEVKMDAETGHCYLKGESYMEQPFEFYTKILNWLQAYLEEGGNSVKLDFELSYVNSSSYRAILDVLVGIKALQDDGKDIEANWLYPEDDINGIQEEGEDLADESDLEMNFVAI